MTDLEILNSVDIAAPCLARWEEMRGDNRSRHCEACDKHVYNLASMTRAEAVSLIREHEGSLCIRMYRRADGTLINQDCPRGIRRVWNSATHVVTASAVALLLLAGCIMVPAFIRNSQPAQPLRTVWATLIADIREWLFPSSCPPLTGDMVMGGASLPPPPPAPPQGSPTTR